MNTDKDRKSTGRLGEDAACSYLMHRGHTILERNWRSGHLEIDIISMDREGIHFVEVKTRRPPMAADPQESVTLTKRRKIVKAAARYLSLCRDRRLEGMESFFDVVSVVVAGEQLDVEYFKGAFVPIFV